MHKLRDGRVQVRHQLQLRARSRRSEESAQRRCRRRGASPTSAATNERLGRWGTEDEGTWWISEFARTVIHSELPENTKFPGILADNKTNVCNNWLWYAIIGYVLYFWRYVHFVLGNNWCRSRGKIIIMNCTSKPGISDIPQNWPSCMYSQQVFFFLANWMQNFFNSQENSALAGVMVNSDEHRESLVSLYNYYNSRWIILFNHLE